MTDLDRFIQRVNDARGISQAEKQRLRQLARSLANAKGEFGPSDRDALNEAFRLAEGTEPASGGPNPKPGGNSGGGNSGGGNSGGGGSGGGGSGGGGSGGGGGGGGTTQRPPQPGAAWIWDDSVQRWIKPGRPGFDASQGSYTWDDNQGWVWVPKQVQRPTQPGAAWVWDEGRQSWVQPPMPTDGRQYRWDNNAGWVLVEETTEDDEDTQEEREADREKESRESASAFFRGLLAQFGFASGDVDGLMGLFDEWIAEGFDNEAIMMKFRGTDVYARRFPGMRALSGRGQAISESEYIRLESAYRGVLSSYGLPPSFYDSPDDYGQFIANNVSPDEVDERASTGMRLLQSSDRRILDELNEYYGVTQGTALAYLLDPNKAQDLIRRQVRSATIGGSGERYGFRMDRAISENLASTSLGQTIDGMNPQAAAQLDQSFITARRQAERERVLAAIDRERFFDTDAVEAMFGDEAKQLASQKRGRRERARFMGSSGVSSGSLSVDRNL